MAGGLGLVINCQFSFAQVSNLTTTFCYSSMLLFLLHFPNMEYFAHCKSSDFSSSLLLYCISKQFQKKILIEKDQLKCFTVPLCEIKDWWQLLPPQWCGAAKTHHLLKAELALKLNVLKTAAMQIVISREKKSVGVSKYNDVHCVLRRARRSKTAKKCPCCQGQRTWQKSLDKKSIVLFSTQVTQSKVE